MGPEGGGILIHASCWSCFENERGFDDYRRVSNLDADFEDPTEAVEYMSRICDESTGVDTYVFFVEVR